MLFSFGYLCDTEIHHLRYGHYMLGDIYFFFYSSAVHVVIGPGIHGVTDFMETNTVYFV